MLLRLIHQKRQEHPLHQYRGQVLLAVPLIVLKGVTLILERVEGLMLDLPPGAPSSHHRLNRLP
jgi:hypothetical protein